MNGPTTGPGSTTSAVDGRDRVRQVGDGVAGRLLLIQGAGWPVVPLHPMGGGRWRCAVAGSADRAGGWVEVASAQLAQARELLLADGVSALDAATVAALWQAVVWRYWPGGHLPQLARLLADLHARRGPHITLDPARHTHLLNQLNVRPVALQRLIARLGRAGLLDLQSASPTRRVQRVRLLLPRPVPSRTWPPPNRRHHRAVFHRTRRATTVMRKAINARIRVLTLIVVTAVAVATGSLWLAGCSKTIEENPEPPPPTLAPDDMVTLGPVPTRAGVQALTAYLGMWHYYQEAVQIPDPDYGPLSDYAAGDALTVLSDGLRALRDQGLRGTGEIYPWPRITAMTPPGDPTQVSIRDCLDTSMSHLVAADPASPYADAAGGRRLCVATVTEDGQGWKVTSFGLREVGTC